MSKRKTAPKKNATRKASHAFKKIAVKAMRLVKNRPAKGAAKAAARPAKPAAKAVPAKAAPATRAPARPAAGPAPRPRGSTEGGQMVGGRMVTEAELRRMSESEYMNDTQLEFFRQRLLQMRNEVVDREVDVKERLHQRESFADPADRATAEEEHWLDLRLRERESLLLRKIDDALRRIRDREYGFCEVTGEPIGIPRLLARPTATVSVDVKGQNEQIESQFRDR